MDLNSEYSTLLANRENLYRFFARLYRIEVDAHLLAKVSAMGFPADGDDGDLSDGYRMLEAYVRMPGPDPINDLAVDYARVFLGAGIYDGKAAYPYESVYTSKERLIMQEARDRVLAAYRAKGLDKVATLEIPEDHIALEFEFMAHLCREARAALGDSDWPAVAVSLQEQKDFLAQHLWNWAPEFCADIQKYSATDFYRAVAKITHGFLRMEQAILEDLLADASARSAPQ